MNIAVPSLLSPKEQSLLTVPFVALDAKFRILSANGAAKAAGILPGECLSCPAGRETEDFLKEHEARFFETEPLFPDALPKDRAAFRLRIAPFHGFRMAYILYEHTLRGHFATAFLFASPRDFLPFAPETDRDGRNATALLKDSLAQLKERCSRLLQNADENGRDTTETLEEFLQASLFLTRVLAPFSPESPEGRRLFRLSRLWEAYAAGVLPNLTFADKENVVPENCGEDLFLPVDAPVLFLLWTTLLYLLSDLGDGGEISVSRHIYGKDGEMRFSAKVPTLPTAARRQSDLSGLAATLPRLSPQILLAQHLAGISAAYLDLLTDKKENRITFSLYIPEEKPIPNFKSPADAETLLTEAIRSVRGSLTVFGAPSQSADHRKE